MQDIRVYRGRKADVPVAVTTAAGAALDLTGAALAFTAVDTTDGTPTTTISLTPTVSGNPTLGNAVIPFLSGTTTSLPEGLTRLLWTMTVAMSGSPVVVASGVLHVIDGA